MTKAYLIMRRLGRDAPSKDIGEVYYSKQAATLAEIDHTKDSMYEEGYESFFLKEIYIMDEK
ncbi:MAG: hypothetical protein DRI37_04235 [Chloroflexi bacterium]|nr:MAG: hypothetical protein DRI37_04235 [Chloroflexota bacterium]